MNTIRAITISALLAGSFAVCSAAVADQAPGAKRPPQEQVSIRYNDLDLSTDAGVATLYTRVRSAANRLCEIATQGEVLARSQTKTACVHEAMVASITQIDNHRLAALHEGR
jgi:UrcA family protein